MQLTKIKINKIFGIALNIVWRKISSCKIKIAGHHELMIHRLAQSNDDIFYLYQRFNIYKDIGKPIALRKLDYHKDLIILKDHQAMAIHKYHVNDDDTITLYRTPATQNTLCICSSFSIPWRSRSTTQWHNEVLKCQS